MNNKKIIETIIYCKNCNKEVRVEGCAVPLDGEEVSYVMKGNCDETP